MSTHPLLRIPNPSPGPLPRGFSGPGNIRLPSKQRQAARYGPVFERLRSILGRTDGVIELRNDPSSLAPERVIVFEIAGTVENFLSALSHIQGLEFMAEYEGDFEADQDFAVEDIRKGKEGLDRTDQPVPAHFYLAMPDIRALQELLSLWERWVRGENLGIGYTPFAHLFAQLRDLRPWGPQDRIPSEAVSYWRDLINTQPNQPVRLEVELWFRDSAPRRSDISHNIHTVVAEAGGQVVHEAIIAEIAYHGLLVDLPAAQVRNLLADRTVRIALVDDIMFIRPQSLMRSALDIDPSSDEAARDAASHVPTGPPIAALFDGVPIPAHALLEGRLVLDDPDDLQSQAVVSRRVHGTAMASLILHGDRNDGGPPLPRPIYVRPVLGASENGFEHSQPGQLLIDTIYQAVLRMKGGQNPVAPTVFLVNLSIGDTRRPFAGIVSPLARLLDWLSTRYDLLFLVAAGNVPGSLEVPDYRTWTEFQSAEIAERQRAVLRALNAAKHERSILSPAESLDALTIGAQHSDNVVTRQAAPSACDPIEDPYLPNISSALGLGHRRMIKPELYFPGGREYVQMQSTGTGLTVAVCAPRRLYGVSAAAPDSRSLGRLDQVALTNGTSAATALATRAAHRIFDALMDSDGGSPFREMDPQYYALLVKTLLVHTSRWNGSDELLKEICGPPNRRRHVERAENVSRFIGFGVPNITEALECASNRATLVGFGSILPEHALEYRIPLPECLERVTHPRSLTLTLAWLSPVKSGHQKYRAVRLEGAPLFPPIQVLGVERRKRQPADPSVKRGSVFHEHYEGESAVPFIDDAHLSLRVWCKQDAGVPPTEAIRYGIAVTIKTEIDLPVYDEIQQRLRIRPRPPA